MNTTAEQAYETFWNRLAPAYPISHGSIRLPITSSLVTLPDFDHTEIKRELKIILQDLLDTQGTAEAAKTRALAANNDLIVPLITSEYTGVIRFDCIWQPETNGVKILEINCDYPDGLLLHDITYSALAETENNLHHELFLSLLTEDAVIHVLHSEHAFFLDSYHTEYQKLIDYGKESLIGHDVTKIPYGATVRRCLETSKMTEDQIAYLKQNDHRCINTLALRTLGYKDLLESIDHDFIPKTVRLTKEMQTKILTTQSDTVLKPADGCEGLGIYFGSAFTQSEWETLVTSLLDQNYIAQERIAIPKQTVSLFDEGTVVTKELYFDLCPHFFIKNGTIIGDGHTLMRYSENPVVNVSQGGGIGYYSL